MHLLIIDPQNDFCDLPNAALPVPGAHADMQRLAALIQRGHSGLSAITVTLDSHHRYDIAHPTFWQAAGGGAVAPFTEITANDVRGGRFLPRDPAAMPRALAYLDALESSERYRLMVWPVHCEIGSWGQNVHDDVRSAYNQWEEARHAVVSKVVKGSNPWTEHYSAVMAEVPDANDPGTQANGALIDSLAQSPAVYIAGEAGSHCVKATTEHIVRFIDPARLVLLTDCMSPVPGFEAQQQDFLRDMAQCGARLASAEQALDEWLEHAAS